MGGPRLAQTILPFHCISAFSDNQQLSLFRQYGIWIQLSQHTIIANSAEITLATDPSYRVENFDKKWEMPNLSHPLTQTKVVLGKIAYFSVKITSYFITWSCKSQFSLTFKISLILHANFSFRWKEFFTHPPWLPFLQLYSSSHFYATRNEIR